MDARLRRIWHSMKSRCYNKNAINFKYYGARGITICSEWLLDFSNFKRWAVANGYNDALTIDRINLSKGYSPENCRWVSMQTQNSNKSNCRHITYNGETKTVAEWAKVVGITERGLTKRLYVKKLPIEEALQPGNRSIKLITYKGRTKNLQEWADELGLTYKCLWNRIHRRGWSVDKAFETKSPRNDN